MKCALVFYEDLGLEKAEAIELVESAGYEILECFFWKGKEINAKYWLSSGRVEKLAEWGIENKEASIIICHDIPPGSLKNLASKIKNRIVDRTQLIFEIFKMHAKSAEGKLQVQMAEYLYAKSKLTHGWSHLEKQRASFAIGGPGERQQELDRRILEVKITRLKKELEKIKKVRNTQRKNRKHMPIIALVGYTNAGKTRIFNLLTKSENIAKQAMFATLDPSVRKIQHEDITKNALMTDTVGFIENLPPRLMEAFEATLDELKHADIILHICDIASPRFEIKNQVVQQTIKKLNLEKKIIFKVWNKLDLLDDEQLSYFAAKAQEEEAFLISATQKRGIKELMKTVFEKLEESFPFQESKWLVFSNQPDALEYIRQRSVILKKEAYPDHYIIHCYMSSEEMHHLEIALKTTKLD